MTIIKFPILYVPDPLKNRPLGGGQIFVGEPDLDPTIEINQKQLRIVQEDGTKVDVSQPFELSFGGVPTYNGATVRLDVDGAFSMKILDKDGAQKYYVENVYEGDPITEYTLQPLLINDLSQAYIFDTVADMELSVNVFPIGKVVTTKSFNESVMTDWIIQSTGVGDLTDGTLSLASGLYAKIQPIAATARPEINPLAMGVIVDDLSDSNRLALRNAFFYCANNGYAVAMPKGRFPSVGTITEINNLTIRGSGMPNIRTDRTALVDGTGTIFQNATQLTGDNISITDCGWDCGSDTGLVTDGLIINGRQGNDNEVTIKNIEVKRIRSLGSAQDNAFHCVLLQGIDGLDIDDIYTHYNDFGCVIKCQNVQGGDFYGDRHGLASCYPKSDPDSLSGGTYGLCKNVHINSIMYSGNITETVSVACEIYASNLDIENVVVDSVISVGGGFALKVRGKSGLTNAKDITVGSVVGKSTYQDVKIDPNVDICHIGSVTTNNPRRGVIWENDASNTGITVGSISGKNNGSKDIDDLDVVLRGDICVDTISVQSTNTTPTVSFNNVVENRVGRIIGLKAGFEQELTLLNGYAVEFVTPTIKHENDGFRLVGRLDVTGATGDKVATLPTVLTITDAVLMPCGAYDSVLGYVATTIYIQNDDVAWLDRVNSPDIEWIDLNGVFIRYND